MDFKAELKERESAAVQSLLGKRPAGPIEEALPHKRPKLEIDITNPFH